MGVPFYVGANVAWSLYRSGYGSLPRVPRGGGTTQLIGVKVERCKYRIRTMCLTDT